MRDVRHYAFAGIQNFRDFGGVARRDGWMESGALFRSAHLADANEADIAALQALNLRTIIDLRRPSERMRHPTPPGLSARIVVSDLGDQEEAPHLAFLRQGDTSDRGVEEFLLSYYRAAPFEPRHIALFTEAFAAARPMLIHCTAGKDRTGLLAALIQAAVGVHRDDIVSDFLATNMALSIPENIARARAVAKQALGREPTTQILHAMCGVCVRHLEAAFDSIIDQTGSIESYVARFSSSRKARVNEGGPVSPAETAPL